MQQKVGLRKNFWKGHMDHGMDEWYFVGPPFSSNGCATKNEIWNWPKVNKRISENVKFILLGIQNIWTTL